MTAGLIGLQFGALAVLYHRFWLGTVKPLYPPAAMIAFLLFPLVACVALLLFPGRYPRVARLRMLLDGAIMAASLFVVAWATLLREVFNTTRVDSLHEVLSIACPIAGVLTVTVAVLVLARANAQWRQTLRVLAIGLTLIAASGGAYVFLLVRHIYLFDSFLGLGWPAGLVAIGIAGLSSPADLAESATEPQSTIAPISLWLPYIPMSVAGGLEIARFRETLQSDPALAAAPWLIVAVLARQFMVVAENRRLLHSASDRALRDPLTNLANRVLFHDRLDHAIQLYHRDRRSVAVLSMDLDDFKLINDNLGHPAGDALLVQAAQRLMSCVRTGDTVARLGGDEFAVLIEDAGENAHLIVYQIMEAFERPFSTDGEVIFMRPSAGLAVAGLDDPELRAPALLKQADLAMYSAKRIGGGLQTFSPDMHMADDNSGTYSTAEVQPTRGGLVEVRLLSDLRQAISHRALTVLYQPKVDLQTARVVGAEALVRWPHPVFGMVQPHQFLPLVRQHGLMRSFTDLILDQALGDAAQWRDRGMAVPVAVNLFPPLVGDINLPGRIFEALERHQLPGDALIVEITEDLLLDNIDRTRQVLEALRENHIHVALDDFGSGYSALTYLRKLPIDEVKVDYDLISHVLTDPRAEAIVQAVIDLSHALNVTTVAEGVENNEIAAWLRDRGCEVAQGILYSPPITGVAMMDLLVSPASR
ncbi:bifunctional diguanylate cyclase/phosphodiesterase [Candidatus Mycobacterium wuenschmannii]|uniref:Bifunctional diguanylate cyclase/phosphodiesterase n=1 Tax=Candidatus Mycobacterium wuenschmannii TaxID=3027808 RepID=A0ABY8W0P4_9MYCO|nr:bifunctional diguanylate cyclase/phosphodiesterase [Candidatus Mycobacterium wuenschmannii]WIM88795.1 bifunctional diguanylate cyclase/phosphodiesterase [Candidatus Mycobacterium wuenschmannii]